MFGMIGQNPKIKHKPSGPPPPVWPFGLDGDLIQIGGTLTWDAGTTYDYNNISLEAVDITIAGSIGAFVLIGAAGNFSMKDCVVTGTDNEDVSILYTLSGQGQAYTYSVTSPAGDVFNYLVNAGHGGNGGIDGIGNSGPGVGAWGSGGGGASGINDGQFASQVAGGNGGDGDTPGDHGVGGGIFGNNGTDGASETSNGSGGGGGGLGLSGQNIAFKIAGNVTQFSGNTFFQFGQDGGGGGTAGDGLSGLGVGGGGGGSGAGGFGGAAIFKIHGTGSGLIFPDQFSLNGGSGGIPGSGGGGTLSGIGGNMGDTGQDGSLTVFTY